MKRYVIERSLPGVGKINREQLKSAAATSNDALAKLPRNVQWVAVVRRGRQDLLHLPRRQRGAVQEHARLSGFPANKITEVRTIIDPMTALPD